MKDVFDNGISSFIITVILNATSVILSPATDILSAAKDFQNIFHLSFFIFHPSSSRGSA
jgi:hypothetical protein